MEGEIVHYWLISDFIPNPQKNSILKICVGKFQKFSIHWIRIKIWSHMMCIYRCYIVENDYVPKIEHDP